MTLSDDDFDYCPDCGKPVNDRIAHAAAVAWLIALALVSIASALVIALCIRALQ